MYIGTYVRILMLGLLLSGCATQSNTQSGTVMNPPDSLVELMDYNARAAALSGSEYVRELHAARADFDRSGSSSSRMRLAILLMNSHGGDAMGRFRESEKLLKSYIDDQGFAFFDRDYGAFARLLLTINQEWQRMQNQLMTARVESQNAHKKLEELKSIEMQLNHPGNGYH